MSYISKIKNGADGPSYDIRDRRIPITSTADKDKYLHVNETTGDVEWSEVDLGTADYPELTNKPVLNTDNTSAQTVSSSETILGTINLHKVSKTGNYNDLNNLPSSPGNGALTVQAGATASGTFTANQTGDSTIVIDATTHKELSDAIDALPQPMVFKGTIGTGGTITTLPTASASNEGHTYKVITAGTYAGQEAKVGDVFISNGSAWVLIPSGDDINDTWRNIKINGTELLGTGISSGAVNFKSGTNVTVSGSGNDVTISATDTNTTYSLTQDASDGHKITLTPSSGTAQTITIPDNNTTYSAGTGLSLSGTTFNHSNSVTAGTAQGDASKTLTFGGTFTIPTVTYDARGHVTSKGTTTMTMPANPNTDTKVTSVGNHYTPSGGTATTPTSSGTATRGSTVVMTGITKDAAGHITGVTGYTLPASDNTTYTFSGGTNGFTVTPSGGSAQTVTVTPSITNNITGSGTSGYIAKFNGGNTITSGPAIGTSTTTYLRNDGAWATPPNTDTKVTSAFSTTNADEPILLNNGTSATTNTVLMKSGATINPSTGNLKITQINGVTVGSSPKFTDTITDVKGVGFSNTSDNPLSSTVTVALRNYADNPFIGLQCNNVKYYLQATTDGVYLGPTSTVATSWDSSGNITIRGTNRPKWNNSNIALTSDVPTIVLNKWS